MKLFLITLIHPLRVTSHGDDVQDFETLWDEVLLSISQVPSDDILASLYKMREYVSLITSKPYWQCTNKKLIKISRPSDQKLKTMVKRCIGPKSRARNFEARNERIETGILVKTRKGKHVSVQRNKENAINGKEKVKCTKGNASSFRHDEMSNLLFCLPCGLACIPFLCHAHGALTVCVCVCGSSRFATKTGGREDHGGPANSQRPADSQ